ncbi:MAG: hypothetical protein RLZZ182_53, partial [Pseudomonadota bacterium]
GGSNPGDTTDDGTNGTVNRGDGIDATETAAWQTYLNNNAIKAYAVGLTSDVSSTTYLNPVAYDGHASSDMNGILVQDLTKLDAQLAATVNPTVTGKITGTLAATAMGADGFGHVDSITVGTSTFTYDAANPIKVITTSKGGILTLNTDTSEFSYSPSTSATAGSTDSVAVVLTDKDGDKTTTSLDFTVTQTGVQVGTAASNTLTGTDAPDRLLGRDGDDILNGAGGSDDLFGNGGNDALNGGAGDDKLHGGAGNDTMTGGLGSDVFAWHLSDPGATAATRAVDTIVDFNVAAPSAGGDVLDLRDLLTGSTATNIENYLDIATSVNSTTIRISPTGGFSNGTYDATKDTQEIVLQGVNLRDVNTFGLDSSATDKQIIDKLIEQGKLLIGNN